MECKKVREKLSAFVDKELKDNDRLKIEQHLAGCFLCRQEERLLSQAWDILEVWEDLEVPDNFERRERKKKYENG